MLRYRRMRVDETIDRQADEYDEYKCLHSVHGRSIPFVSPSRGPCGLIRLRYLEPAPQRRDRRDTGRSVRVCDGCGGSADRGAPSTGPRCSAAMAMTALKSRRSFRIV